MTMRFLAVGDRVRGAGAVCTVVGISGPRVLLADENGGITRLMLAEVMAADDFEVVDRPRPVPLSRGIEGLPKELVDKALWWEGHLIEVLRGRPREATAGTGPPQGYDPAAFSLAQRERRKAEELTAAGFPVSARTVKHYRQRYQAAGLRGLVDGRTDKRMPAFGRTDARVVEAMREAITETVGASTHTIGFVCWRTGVLLKQRYGPDTVPLPSQRTLYRLFDKLAVGTHAAGTARTRHTEQARPPTPFGRQEPGAPGEVMQIDSTPLDVLVRLGEGLAGTVELTAMVDVATRSITAAVLRPTTKAADATVLLARTVTPEPMRPGWAAALSMQRSVLPYRRLLEIDDRIRQAAARPVILPETIVVDHGKAFVSQAFKNSCRFLGINLQPARKARGSDKGVIERTLGSAAALFAQFVSGYTGSGVEHRGRAVTEAPLWSLPELQALLDEWIIALWQNREHDALRDPSVPGRAFTPNEKYAALVEAAGYIALALGPDDFVQLLPSVYRAVNAYGIRTARRTYDDAALNPLRRQPSGDKLHHDLWEVRYDPYDVSRIWVRESAGGWITVFWTHLRAGAAPFGETAWDHVRERLPQATEQELAREVQDLLERAHRGPGNAAKPPAGDQRVAARTRATAQPLWPRPAVADPVEAQEPEPEPELEADDEAIAPVIPMGIFDPYQEAKKRW
jgi:hypothetical protein